MEIGVSFMCMDMVHSWLLMAARTDTYVSILKCSATRWRFNADRSMMGHRYPVFFGTFGWRTREMFRSESSLWLPWTAGHPRPFGDPGSCSWCGTRCCDEWVEVNVGSLDPPLPQLHHVNVGLLLKSGLLQKTCDGGTHWDIDGLPGRTLHERTACPVWWSSEWWVDL